MKFGKTFLSDVFHNSQQISKKSSLKSLGGRFLNNITVRRQKNFAFQRCSICKQGADIVLISLSIIQNGALIT